MKKLQLLVREKQWFGQKHVFLRVLGFYFLKCSILNLLGFSKNLTKNIKKKLCSYEDSSQSPVRSKEYEKVFLLHSSRKE